jgi:hypothetical protein
MTGSGRLYNLKTIDSASFAKAEFSKALVDRFAKGFPDKWQEMLLAELGHAKTPVSPPRTAGKLLKMPASNLRTPKTPTSKKTPARKSSTPKSANTKRSPSRLLLSDETPKILGSTRSGRKIVTPIPFWDTKALSAFKPSPTVLVKRRWGNRVVDVE